MRKITEEEAKRTEHIDGCQGWEDCECFSERCGHADIYAMQAEIERLRAMVEWRPIATAPVNQQIILADMSNGNRYMYIGIIYASTGPGRATHWLPMLPLPNAITKWRRSRPAEWPC